MTSSAFAHCEKANCVAKSDGARAWVPEDYGVGSDGVGWLWTSRRGIVQMYISGRDRFVWIERTNGRPWLITPEEPEAFVRAASGSQPTDVLESV